MTPAEPADEYDDRTISLSSDGCALSDRDQTLSWAARETILTPQIPAGNESPAEIALWNCAAFSSLHEDLRALVAAELELRHLTDNEPLIVQGQAGCGLWIVVNGAVTVQVVDEHGQTKFIDTSGPGDVLGEMSLLTHQPATAHAIASGPTDVYLLSTSTFQKLASEHQSLYVVLANVIASRLGRRDIDVLAGKTLDRYRIRSRLGQGGMSVVYDADSLDDGRRVALKMMSHRLIYEQEALDSFQCEADVIERFDHPNIVRLLGRFKAFHTYFIAMEYCDGEDLKSLITRRGALPVDEVRVILGQLASALDYSHRNGIVHRDLKPSNVMLTLTGQVKLMDFGLAKYSVDDAHPTTLVMGSPRYMPIEQLRGEPVDRTADYFAFGCIAYELLKGRPLITAFNKTALMELHEQWSVERVITDCREFGDDLAAVLQGTLQPLAADRHVDLAAVARWSA